MSKLETHVRLSPEISREVERLAQQELRSSTKQIEVLVIEALEARKVKRVAR